MKHRTLSLPTFILPTLLLQSHALTVSSPLNRFITPTEHGYAIQAYQHCPRDLFRNSFLGFAFDLRSDSKASGLLLFKTPLGTLGHILSLQDVYASLSGDEASFVRPTLTLKTKATQSWGLQGLLDLYCHKEGFQRVMGHLTLPVQSFTLQVDAGYEKGSGDLSWKSAPSSVLKIGLSLKLNKVSKIFGQSEMDALFDHGVHSVSKKRDKKQERVAERPEEKDDRKQERAIIELERKSEKQRSELAAARDKMEEQRKELVGKGTECNRQAEEILSLRGRIDVDSEQKILMLQQELEALKKDLEEKNKLIDTPIFRTERESKEIIANQRKQAAEYKKELKEKDQKLAENELKLQKVISSKDETIAAQTKTDAHKDQTIAAQTKINARKDQKLAEKESDLGNAKLFMELTKTFSQKGWALFERDMKSGKKKTSDENLFELRRVTASEGKEVEQSEIDSKNAMILIKTAKKLHNKGLIITQKAQEIELSKTQSAGEDTGIRLDHIETRMKAFDQKGCEIIQNERELKELKLRASQEKYYREKNIEQIMKESIHLHPNEIESFLKDHAEKLNQRGLEILKEEFRLKGEENVENFKKTHDEEKRNLEEKLLQLQITVKDDEETGQAIEKKAKLFAEIEEILDLKDQKLDQKRAELSKAKALGENLYQLEEVERENRVDGSEVRLHKALFLIKTGSVIFKQSRKMVECQTVSEKSIETASRATDRPLDQKEEEVLRAQNIALEKKVSVLNEALSQALEKIRIRNEQLDQKEEKVVRELNVVFGEKIRTSVRGLSQALEKIRIRDEQLDQREKEVVKLQNILKIIKTTIDQEGDVAK